MNSYKKVPNDGGFETHFMVIFNNYLGESESKRPTLPYLN